MGSVAIARVRLVSLAALACLVTGCAGLSAPACRQGRAVVNDLLYFGTAKPDGAVSAQEWHEFLDSVVTPRFPDGLTVWQASGQWKSSSGALVREPTYILNLVHPDSAVAEAALSEIRSAYKLRFRQESVLRLRTGACASF